MFKFVTGDLLQSDAYALINTVNCEGYMGKGIAYQFKLRFPEMNIEYMKECRNHRLTPGKLYCYQTENKFIINFPTKNKWREKSKMEYIISGLDELVKIIKMQKLLSVAIPPLGCGNGGLTWSEVKTIIIEKLSVISDDVDVYIYEPSRNYKTVSSNEPQLSLSALILMNIKFNLQKDKFNKIGLQKTAYFMNVLSSTEYFHFKKEKYGPFDYSIEIISKNIQEFQKYYGVQTTKEAYDILIKKIISQPIQEKLDFYMPFIIEASKFTNQCTTTEEVEGAGTALFIIQQNKTIEINDIILQFKQWSDDKAKRFSNDEIKKAVISLETFGFIENTLYGYQIKS
ncbi:MAG: Appr-1-p processing protein [Ruminococcus sp.]|nr:Appr-1-p processing protein [Ruminococcus sp.]